MYRLYKNHGQFSKLSVTTNKIQVFSSGRIEELGNAAPEQDDDGKLSDSNSGIGYRLKVDLGEFSNIYDRVQLFRIQYYTQDIIKVFLIAQSAVHSG